jgi:hypothetical protein
MEVISPMKLIAISGRIQSPIWCWRNVSLSIEKSKHSFLLKISKWLSSWPSHRLYTFWRVFSLNPSNCPFLFPIVTSCLAKWTECNKQVNFWHFYNHSNAKCMSFILSFDRSWFYQDIDWKQQWFSMDDELKTKTLRIIHHDKAILTVFSACAMQRTNERSNNHERRRHHR